jgi:hypothetical protein
MPAQSDLRRDPDLGVLRFRTDAPSVKSVSPRNRLRRIRVKLLEISRHYAAESNVYFRS